MRFLKQSPKVIALLAVSLFGVASLLYALPQVGGDVEFYDSPSHTNQVGEWIWYCNAQPTHWGVRSGYALMLDGFSCSHPSWCCHYYTSGFYVCDSKGNCVWHDTGSGIECNAC
jgi:hypothetical protein